MTDARREEQLRIQALGAAISRRDWHAVEQAYNAIRDEFDRRPHDEGGALDREWLKTEISAIDTWYRGNPSYMHDAYWMKDRVLKLLDHPGARAAPPAPVQTASVEAVAGWDAAIEAAARSCEQYVTPYGRAGSQLTYDESAVHKQAAVIRALTPPASLTPAPTQGDGVDWKRVAEERRQTIHELITERNDALERAVAAKTATPSPSPASAPSPAPEYLVPTTSRSGARHVPPGIPLSAREDDND